MKLQVLGMLTSEKEKRSTLVKDDDGVADDDDGELLTPRVNVSFLKYFVASHDDGSMSTTNSMGP